MQKIILLLCFAFYCFSAASAKPIQDDKYSTWYPCLIIAQKDTLAGKIKPKEGDEYFGKGSFTMLFTNGKERVITPSEIAQLWVIMSKDTDRYISVKVKSETGKSTVLYRIVIDGPCQLLYSKGIRPAHMLTLSVNVINVFENAHIFTIYYGGEMWELLADPQNYMLDADTDFRSLGKEVFKECPSVTYKVTTEQASKEDVRDIIRDFNDCLLQQK